MKFECIFVTQALHENNMEGKDHRQMDEGISMNFGTGIFLSHGKTGEAAGRI